MLAGMHVRVCGRDKNGIIKSGNLIFSCGN